MQLNGSSIAGSIAGVGERLRSRSALFAAVGAVSVLVASIMIALSSPRSELDVRLSDGAVWLPSTSIGGISLLDGGSGTIAASLLVAEPGDDFSVEQYASDAVIVNRTDGTVARLDGSSWSIATGRVQFGVPGEPLHVVTGDEASWMMTPGQAATLEMGQLAARSSIPVAAPYAHGIVTADGGLLYASSDPELAVQKFMPGQEPQSLPDLDGPTALIDLGAIVAGVDLDDRSVWVEGQGVVCSELEFPADAVLHAGGGEGHLIIVSDQGGAFVWDVTESGCPGAGDFINLGPGVYGEPALTDGWAVVPETATSSVLVIDLDDMSVIDSQELAGVEPGTEVSLIAEDGSIWYNDPGSARAGLIRRDGTIIPVAKYEDGTSGFTAAPVDDAGDDAEDVSIAGARNEQQVDEQAPEAEAVAGPELTSTTVGGGSDGGDDDRNEPAGTTTTTTRTDNGGEGTTDTTLTTGTTDGTGGTVDTTDGEGGGEGPAPSTSTTEQPVDEGVEISLGASALSVTAGDTINFTVIVNHGNPNDFGLPVVSPSGPELLPAETIGQFRYLFPTPGTFTLTFTACDPDNQCDSATTQVTIVADPDAIPLVAAIDGPTTVVVGETATFRDISQGDPDSWSWGTDNGTPATGGNDTIDVSWTLPGPKTVTLTVGRDGLTRTATFPIDVVAAPQPSPFGLLCAPSSVAVSETVNCQLDGDAADFSDISFSTDADGAAGFTSSTPAPGRFTMSSSTARTVTVTLTATDDATGTGVSDSVSATFDAPVCAAVVPTVAVNGPATVEVGAAGSFTGTPADGCGAVSRSWTATGGGSISSPTSANTTISWASAGTYTVTYSFSDGGGSSSDSMTVVVQEPDPGVQPPSISINGNGSLETNESGSYSASNTGGPIDSYSWSTNGGGGSGSGDTFSASWNSAGNYTVTLNVTGPGGSDTATYAVSVTDPVIPPSPFGMACSVSSAEVDEIFSCDLTTGNPNDFSNPVWSASPASAQSWLMNPWSYDAAGTVAGSTVTVTLTATDLATGQTVSQSDLVSITAPVVQPANMTVGCSQGTAEVNQIVSCFLTSGNESAFSSPSWTITGSHDRWGGGFSLDIAGTAEGTLGITLSATDIATGQTVTASTSLTVTAPAPPPPTPENLTVGCSVATATVGQRFNCALTSGNAGSFSGLTWTVSPAGNRQTWGGGGSLDIAGTVAGVLTIQLTGTDIATGQVVSDSTTVTIQ